MRRPFVVTLSLASLTPCCNNNGKTSTSNAPPSLATVNVSSSPPSNAATSAQTAAPSASVAASAHPKTTEPWAFETDPRLVNPLVGKKRVVWMGGVQCVTFGREDDKSTGIQFDRHPTPCPSGIETTLANCIGGLLAKEDTVCQCIRPEGNPPRPPEIFECP